MGWQARLEVIEPTKLDQRIGNIYRYYVYNYSDHVYAVPVNEGFLKCTESGDCVRAFFAAHICKIFL